MTITGRNLPFTVADRRLAGMCAESRTLLVRGAHDEVADLLGGRACFSAAQSPHPLPHFLVTRVRVDGRGQGRHVPREPLRQEQVPRQPVDRRDRCVSQPVKRIQPIKPRRLLPLPPRELDPARRDPPATLRAEQGVASADALAPVRLPVPECPGAWPRARPAGIRRPGGRPRRSRGGS